MNLIYYKLKENNKRMQNKERKRCLWTYKTNKATWPKTVRNYNNKTQL